MEAAQLIRAARRRSGLTQTEYAASVGVSQPAISAYEQGRREPTLPTLRRLVRGAGTHLRIDIAWDETDLVPPRDLEEHGRRLVDLLELADAIPHSRHGELLMPRLDSTRLDSTR